MPKTNKKFYITTSIPYTNAAPHIGFALEAIQADVLARWHKNLGEDSFFLTGTDEHGIKTLRVAKEAGKEPQEFADEVSGKFRDLTKVLNLSNNDFIRTTDEERHRPAVEKIWKALEKNGDIYKKKYKGYYCPGCEAFKTPREVVDGKCTIHQKPVELVEEENYFFRLTKYIGKIKEAIINDDFDIVPETRKNETLAMLEQGLEDVSFSRTKDKYWGFPVPGDASQVMYVWCDALPNYLSGIGYTFDEKKFKKYWPADVHCIGKDIMKFHTIFWPAMLISLGLELPKAVFVHGFITSEGQKMSKSLGNVVDPFETVKKYGVDAVRYYLLREIPSVDDGDFSIEKFELRYNADLAGGIGNLLARTLALANKLEIKPLKKIKNSKLQEETEKAKESCTKFLGEFNFSEALKSIWELIAFCNKYIDEQKPWETKDGAVIADLLLVLGEIGALVSPFMPETSEKIKEQLKDKKSQPLFPRI